MPNQPEKSEHRKRFIIDGHLDLAMNAIEWNRDLRQPLEDIRVREMHMPDKPDRGNGTVCLPELQKGRIGLVVATQLSRYTPPGSKLAGWHSPQQAWAMTQAQLAWYREMEALGLMVQITNLTELDKNLQVWEDDSTSDQEKPIGYILSLEGADSLVDVSYLEKACRYGLKAINLSHFGPGRYAPGTRLEGGLTSLGKELIDEMNRLVGTSDQLILDITHLTDAGFDEALERYQGPVWASHHNVRKIVPNQRQLTDEQIQRLIERDAIIGGMLDCWAMDLRFIDTVSDPWQLDIRLEHLIDHWDHICQIAGNSNHIAIGSDLDGIFGTEQSPWDMNSIADLQKYDGLLSQRGYADEDIDAIFHGNWLRFLRKVWD
ncbi:membrane dipeptidase [Membranicola marinus]|uniref:Membrane dipeptidase n=1 Tax=Membranihabitans marinus TaxID=1227546 RepID=A0A953HXZ8_9BACT|nr:membrane dipeptidase [Membranihabitans marinus]MBY5960265.1 membrane dipeptidase [Membranihabitans marinus]